MERSVLRQVSFAGSRGVNIHSLQILVRVLTVLNGVPNVSKTVTAAITGSMEEHVGNTVIQDTPTTVPRATGVSGRGTQNITIGHHGATNLALQATTNLVCCVTNHAGLSGQ